MIRRELPLHGMTSGDQGQVLDQKSIIEALLFASAEPLSAKVMANAVGVSPASVREVVEQLNGEYAASGRSFRIEEVAGGFRMFTLPEFAPYIAATNGGERQLSLSRAALETLAVVAYKQPVTKAEIERIRGVDCDGVLRGLMAKNLIRIDGRSVAPGKPFLFATTEYFLEFFGLPSLDHLPPLPKDESPARPASVLTIIRPAEEGANVTAQSDVIVTAGDDSVDNQDQLLEGDGK